MKTSRIVCAMLPVAVLAGAGAASGQQDREALIEEARAQFSDSVALTLLGSAVNPAIAPIDSLWAVGVFDLALTLIGREESSRAAVWLRWAARHGAAWPVDPTWFPPSMIDAYEQAISAVRAGAGSGDGLLTTNWRWPSDFDPGSAGLLEVGSAPQSVPLSVSVDGRDSVEPGGVLALEPGTYQMVASADGYETVTATREILPGATTVLEFELPPLLPPDVQAAVTTSLVRIDFTTDGQQQCTNGLVRQRSLVLTSLSFVEQAAALEVQTSSGLVQEASAAVSDPERDLAVLRVETGQTRLLPLATGVVDGQYAWSVHHAGCAGPTSARTRLAGWITPPTGPVALTPELPVGAIGAPLVDRSGALIGLITAADQVTPPNLAQDLLASAVQEELEGAEEAAQAGGGGFPILWVGAGAAAIGVAALVLGGGGGGGGDVPGGNGTVRRTGIEITLSGG